MEHAQKSDLVDIDVLIVHTTERAVLVNNGGDDNIWLPLALVELAPSPTGTPHTLTLPVALATEKGLV